MSSSPSPPTAEALADLILQLTSPTSTNIRHAEAAVLAHLSTPAVIPALSQLLLHPAPQVRHLSAILLRRALNRHIPPPSPASTAAPNQSQLLTPVKESVLPLLTKEPNPAARRGLIALATYICKVQQALWPQLTTAAIELSQSQDLAFRASAFSIFQSLCDTVPDVTLPHLHSITSLVSSGLSDGAPPVRLSALRAYAAIANAAVVRTIDLQPLMSLLPLVVSLAISHPDHSSDDYARIASTVFDVLAIMIDNAPPDVVSSYFADACSLALNTFSDHKTCRQARSAANEFLVFVVATRPNSTRADGIAVAIIRSACAVVFHDAHRAASIPEAADDDVDDGDYDPIHLALRVLYAMAKRPELSKLVFSNVMLAINDAFSQAAAKPDLPVKPYAAGYRIISAISEGCGDDLTTHVHDVFAQLVKGALDDSHGFPTRARALEALGCVCEYLDTYEMPDELIVNVANSALDAILSALRHEQTFVCKAACISLEAVLAMYVQGSDGLRPRVSDILRALGAVGADVAEEAVMAIGVLAEHAPEAFNESDMYNEVIQWILTVMANTAEDRFLVRAAATSAAGALMANCTDQSVVERLAAHAIEGLNSDEPALRQATFRFFARMSDVIGGNVVSAFGPAILKAAILSMERETINFREEDEEDADPALFNTAAGDGDDDDDDDNVLEVHTAYLDEKMVAVAAVGALSSSCAMDSFIERASREPDTAAEVCKLLAECVPTVEALTKYFQEDVRASSYQAMCRMALANTSLQEKSPSLAFSRTNMVKEVFPLLTYCLQEDDDIEVVTSALSSCASFFAHISAEALNEHRGSIVSSLHMLLCQKAVCQLSYDAGDGEGDEDDEDGGDARESLMEAVGEVIVAMGCLLRGYFAEDFSYLLTFMLESMCVERASARNQGTALGTIAGVLLYMNWDRCRSVQVPAAGSKMHERALATADETAVKVVRKALDVLHRSESRKVRQNAMFLVGVIFGKTRRSRSEVWEVLPQALAMLEKLLGSGDGGHGALMDNAAGALARIMFAEGLGEERQSQKAGMLRAVLKCIPVKNDPAENTNIALAVWRMSRESFDILLEPGIVGKVVSCLVSAILAYREVRRKVHGRVWSSLLDVDVCDEIAMFKDEDIAEFVALLQKVTQVAGQTEVEKLQLTATDGKNLAEMTAAFRGGT